MASLVESKFWNPGKLFIFISFHNQFQIMMIWYFIQNERHFLLLSLLMYSEMIIELITFNNLSFHLSCHASFMYSVIHISIHPSKELCSKMAPGEVGV